MDHNERQHHSETSAISASHLQVSTDLKKAVGHLILKSRLACSLPALEPREFSVAVEAWIEIINGAVPAMRLNDAYLSAMRNRETNFAIGAPEIVKAWKEIQESERHKGNTAWLSRMLSGDVCARCHGTGTEVIMNGNVATGSRPCDHAELAAETTA